MCLNRVKPTEEDTAWEYLFDSHKTEVDEVAEWLRRWTANPMGSARVGSNPILVEIVLYC